jgi:4-diphosphocytidyl-2-C-methyl-D-erythritol kinase
MPALSEVVTHLEELGAVRAMVSGSGPTIAALFETQAKAEAVAKVLTSEGLFALTTTGMAQGSTLDS